MLDPLQPGTGLSWRNPQEPPRYTPVQLTVPQAAEWGKWAQRVGGLRTPTVAVAIRRMLAAVAERNTTEDVLVDVVIVLENLVGAKTETMLRVCSSLAWLLGSDKEVRLTQQGAFKKMYELRSKLVHGDASPDRKKVAESSRDAVKVSLMRCIQCPVNSHGCCNSEQARSGASNFSTWLRWHVAWSACSKPCLIR